MFDAELDVDSYTSTSSTSAEYNCAQGTQQMDRFV